MSKFASSLLGAAALVVALGATQLASGQNLPGIAAKAVSQADAVNRSAKADSVATAARQAGRVVTEIKTADAMTVVTRVKRPERSEIKLNTRSSKRPVACEASASVLTDVAKLMDSARCVT